MDDDKIRISLDEVESAKPLPSQVTTPEYGYAPADAPPGKHHGQPPNPPGESKYGSVAVASSGSESTNPIRQLFMQGWVYMSLAGFLGALLAWGGGEIFMSPYLGKIDRLMRDNMLKEWRLEIFSLHIYYAVWISSIFIATCTAMGLAESIVERSPHKAIQRGGIAIGAGLVLGFLSVLIVEAFHAKGLYEWSGELMKAMGVEPVEESRRSARHPLQWIRRALCYSIYGLAAGLAYGLTGWSAKKCLFGAIGGLVGAGIGGFFYDPITVLFGGSGSAGSADVISRAFTFTIMGAFTGLAVGLVETALKDRWLYVSAGPLAGKQFILYKVLTTIGSDQRCDVYLFKDETITPQHAVIEMRGKQTILNAQGPVQVRQPDGRSSVVRPGQPFFLSSGQHVVIGRYTFHFQEKSRRAS